MAAVTSHVNLIEPHDADLEALAALWSDDLPTDLPVSPRLLAWTLAPHPGRTVALLGVGKRALRGYAVVSKLQESTIGVVDALVPARRSARESSLQLVQGAEAWLRAQGASAIQFGGGAYSLLRGIPAVATRPLDGWTGGLTRPVHDGGESDLVLDVSRYAPPGEMETVAGVVRTAQPRDRDELAAFFAAPAFIILAAGNAPAGVDDLALAQEVAFAGRTSDLMVLFTARGVEGVCHVLFADSAVPIELAYPYALPKPWGALGLVACAERLGEAGRALLLDAAIRRLHNNGVNSAVALGVSAPLLYERFGFVPHRVWRQRVRTLST